MGWICALSVADGVILECVKNSASSPLSICGSLGESQNASKTCRDSKFLFLFGEAGEGKRKGGINYLVRCG